jgi:DNA-binding transcriptional MerR regulator
MPVELMSIGRLARRAGTPAKTIRFYDQAGLLRPTATSRAGYRLYDEAALARLSLVRSLRELGFPIPAIRSMLREPRPDVHALRAQLDVVQAQIRSLERQRAILASALGRTDGGNAMEALRLAHAAASLGAAERRARVSQFMRRASGDSADASAAALREMVVGSLPDELRAEQLEAWLELSALLEDPRLLAVIDRQRDAFPKDMDPAEPAKLHASIGEILAQARAYVAQRREPHDQQVRSLAWRWAGLFAGVARKKPDARFVRWFARFVRETNDRRIERFWSAVARLHGRAESLPFCDAQELLVKALEAGRRGRRSVP